jgi:ABC-type transport system involved in cytochrome bd biosynthesis fused ATPase/permease subunit
VVVANPDATEDQLVKAIGAAQLGPWVDSLPEGLDTQVGENGRSVSGGQRQRIALARALLANAPVLVLDEPTSGLDRATAERLLDDVMMAAGERTVICITHREEELHLFKRVIRVENGHIDMDERCTSALANGLASGCPLAGE